MTLRNEAPAEPQALAQARIAAFADDVRELLREWRDSMARDMERSIDDDDRESRRRELQNVERLMDDARALGHENLDWPFTALFSPVLTGNDVLRAMAAHILGLNGSEADTGGFGRKEFGRMMELSPDMETVMREIHGRMSESSDVLHLIHRQSLVLARVTFENLPPEQRKALTEMVLDRQDR